MNTLKNIQIAREYNVSSSTVTRWIQLCLEGKNNLQLFEKNKKHLILDNPHNRAEITRLVEEGKKYRSNIDCKRTTPSKKFYEVFTDNQLIDILHVIKTEREISHKYSYINQGAELWDKFIMDNEPNDGYLTGSRLEELLNENFNYINYKLDNYEKLNIINIGPGNSIPVREVLSKFIKAGKLNKYIMIDISPEMLKVSEKNVKKWFPELECVSIVGDAENINISEVCFENHNNNNANLILYLGSTIGMHKNQSRVFDNIHTGLENNDLFIFSNTIDNTQNRSSFFYAKNPNNYQLHTWIAKEIGIDIDLCELKTQYDPITNAKVLNLFLDKDYEISFEVNSIKGKLELYRGEPISLWRMHMTDINKLTKNLNESGLKLTAAMTDKDWMHVMVITQLR